MIADGDREVERAMHIPGRAGLSEKEKDEAGRKKTELGAERERERRSGIK